MTPDERKAQLAIARKSITHFNGGRPRKPRQPLGPKAGARRFYRMCQACVKVKIIYRSLEAARLQRQRFGLTPGARGLKATLHGNTLRVVNERLMNQRKATA